MYFERAHDKTVFSIYGREGEAQQQQRLCVRRESKLPDGIGVT
jgi:hypothetical protein